MDNKILNFVKKVRGRIKEQTVIDGVIASTVIGLSVSLIILILSLWISMYYAIPVSAGMVLLSFVVGISAGIRKAPTLEQAALAADSKGYKEKFVTAFTLLGKDDTFSSLQKKDAVKHMDSFSVKKEFPIRVSWKKCALLLALVLAFGIVSILDTPARRLAVTRHEVKNESLNEIEKLEKIKKELSKAEKLEDIDKAELDKEIEQAENDMRKAESFEDIKKAGDIITKKMEMQTEKIKDASAKKILENAVSQNKADQAKKIEEAMKETEKAMKKAASGDEKSKKDSYEKLNKLAEVSGDAGLKKAANDFKNSEYSNSEYLAANQAFEKAKDGMNNSDIANNSGKNSRSGNDGQKDGQGQNDNNDQQGNQSRNGNNGQQGNQGQNGNNGQQGNQSRNGNNGQQGNQGQNGNNGQQGNQGQNGNSGQNGAGPEVNGGGDNSTNTGNGGGTGWNRGSKNGIEGKAKINENVTIPEGKIGNDDNLYGKANGNDSSTKQKSSQANTWSGNKVSYGQVSGEYKEKAYKKVNGSDYPGEMKERIRDYFDGLE